MGWFAFVATWIYIAVVLWPQIPMYEPILPPLEEKFVVTTYEEESCTNLETLTSRLIKTVEQVKID